jgi:hypothetical protein
MNLKDPEAWEACKTSNPPPEGYGYDPREWPDDLSSDSEQAGRGYGACVIFFAEVWAEEMEERMASGATLADIASASSHYADNIMGRWGPTGFQYGAAVATLTGVREHGEELRRWHNLDAQIGDEGERANEDGGVLNPALMTVTTRSNEEEGGGGDAS